MAFMTFMTSDLKKNFSTLHLFLFDNLLHRFVNYRSHMTLFLSRRDASIKNLRFLMNLFELTGFDGGISPKSKLIYYFCLYLKFFLLT